MKYKLIFNRPNPEKPVKYVVLTTNDAIVTKVDPSYRTDCMNWTIGKPIDQVIRWCDSHFVKVSVIGTGVE